MSHYIRLQKIWPQTIWSSYTTVDHNHRMPLRVCLTLHTEFKPFCAGGKPNSANVYKIMCILRCNVISLAFIWLTNNSRNDQIYLFQFRRHYLSARISFYSTCRLQRSTLAKSFSAHFSSYIMKCQRHDPLINVRLALGTGSQTVPP